MNKYLLLIVMFAMGICFVSCADEHLEEMNNQQFVTIGSVIKDEFIDMNKTATRASISYGTGLPSFENGDALGLYVLDGNGKVLYANVKATYNGSSWSLASAIPYSTSYKYYAYFPYKATPAGGPAVGDTFSSTGADDVFASLIDSWTILQNQSTVENFVNSNLSVDEATSSSPELNIYLSPQMALYRVDGVLPGTNSGYLYPYIISYQNSPEAIQNHMALFVVKPNVDITIWGRTINLPKGCFTNYCNFAESIAVDLGLPSGLKWAAGNVGAKEPCNSGLYFTWGNTYGWYFGHLNSNIFLDLRNQQRYQYSATTESLIDCNLRDGNDAATVNLGGNWRMPTNEEFQELIDNCNSTWTDNYNGTGVKGRIYTSKINGKSVFFPAGGYFDGSSMNYAGSRGFYWTTSMYTSGYAWRYEFNSGGGGLDYSGKSLVFSVRGVIPGIPSAESIPVDLGLPSGLK